MLTSGARAAHQPVHGMDDPAPIQRAGTTV